MATLVDARDLAWSRLEKVELEEEALEETPPAMRLEEWVSLPLLVAMIGAALWSIHTANWVAGTSRLFALGTLGLLAGLWLSRTGMRARWGLVLGLLLGGIASFIVSGNVVPWGERALEHGRELWAATVAWFGGAGGPFPLLPALQASAAAAADTWTRLVSWLNLAVSVDTATDDLALLYFLGLAAWGMGLAGALALFRRHDGLLAAVPAGIALAINMTLVQGSRTPFLVWLVSFLALLVVSSLAGLRRRWDRLRLYQAAHLREGIILVSTVVIAVIVAFALLTPRAAQNPLAVAWEQHMVDRWAELKDALNRLFTGTGPGGSGARGDTLVLKEPPQLTPQVVFLAAPPNPNPPDIPTVRYWRGIAYETYTGRAWQNQNHQLKDDALERAGPAANEARFPAAVSVQIVKPTSDVLYLPDRPARLSRTYKLQTPQSDQIEPEDFVALRLRRVPNNPVAYSAVVYLSAASEEELRAAGTTYPAWVSRYRQLPPGLPTKVQELAQQLTAGLTTPYDKAVAIERYVRDLPQNPDIKAPPTGRDAVEYYLFEAKGGFFDYAATAMAVMLRSVGVPARLVTGYVLDTLDPQARAYVVQEKDRSAWVEVYFPEYGWIPFEPNGNRPPIVRPQHPVTIPGIIRGGQQVQMEGREEELLAQAPSVGGSSALAISFQTVLLLVLAGLVYLIGRAVIDRLQRLNNSPRENIRRIYADMVRRARLFGVRPDPTITAREFTTLLVQKLEEARNGRRKPLPLPRPAPPREEIHIIGEAFSRATYSPHLSRVEDEQRVAEAWSRARWPMTLLLLLRR